MCWKACYPSGNRDSDCAPSSLFATMSMANGTADGTTSPRGPLWDHGRHGGWRRLVLDHAATPLIFWPANSHESHLARVIATRGWSTCLARWHHCLGPPRGAPGGPSALAGVPWPQFRSRRCPFPLTTPLRIPGCIDARDHHASTAHMPCTAQWPHRARGMFNRKGTQIPVLRDRHRG